ncbi:MAG: FHA domain-containing protein [Planctomycetaceae bacterium]
MSERKSVVRDGERQSSGTVLESAEEIRQAIQSARKSPPSADERPGETAGESKAASTTHAFRPRNRPPMAVLCVRFDEEDIGQELAVFASPFVIGRVEGNLVIEHDSEISGRHAELIRVFENGRHYWQLHDLKSTNGTFVRAAVALLKDQQEILIGGRRYRFEIEGDGNDSAKSNRPLTRKAQQAPLRPMQKPLAGLVEVGDTANEQRFEVTATEHWIGRDSRLCSIVLDDPMVSPRHARLYRDKQNRWLLANAKSLNGIWLRINRIDLGNTAQFQLGEQRFSIRVP